MLTPRLSKGMAEATEPASAKEASVTRMLCRYQYRKVQRQEESKTKRNVYTCKGSEVEQSSTEVMD